MTDALLFGLPTTMSLPDAQAVSTFLETLWTDAYGAEPKQDDTDNELQLCRRYFDPLIRGQTLRDRLSQLPPSPRLPAGLPFAIREPLVFEVDSTRTLVGIEARLMLQLLKRAGIGDEFLTLPEESVNWALQAATRVYRSWSLQRIEQVIALQQGGGETLQAVSVGLVLALLVNRSTDPARVLVADNDVEPVGPVKAVFDAAEAFAAAIAGRSERSSSEQRLKGGYALTEARRRLADLRIGRDTEKRRTYFLAPGSERRVLSQLTAELVRRVKLDSNTLALGFDALVHAYRIEAQRSAWLGGLYERPADTSLLREALLTSFTERRSSKGLS